VLASGFDEDKDALPIRTDARVLGATLKAGESLSYQVGDRRYAYMVPATGAIEVDGQRANARDGVAITAGTITITAVEDSEIVLVDSD
jgi:redox-sensitive bicupin YhaK (pirin superfamily)